MNDERDQLQATCAFFNDSSVLHGRELRGRRSGDWDGRVAELSTSEANTVLFWTARRNDEGERVQPIQYRFTDERQREWRLKCIWKGEETYLLTNGCAWRSERGVRFPVRIDDELPLNISREWSGLCHKPLHCP